MGTNQLSSLCHTPSAIWIAVIQETDPRWQTGKCFLVQRSPPADKIYKLCNYYSLKTIALVDRVSLGDYCNNLHPKAQQNSHSCMK